MFQCKFKKQTNPKKQSNSNQCGCFFGAFYYSDLPDTDYLGRWIVIIVCAEPYVDWAVPTRQVLSFGKDIKHNVSQHVVVLLFLYFLKKL